MNWKAQDMGGYPGACALIIVSLIANQWVSGSNYTETSLLHFWEKVIQFSLTATRRF